MTDAERKAAANAFAMELLMPRAAFIMATNGLDLNDDAAVARVAKAFKVTVPVAAARYLQIQGHHQ
jgi:Zn-dependent peptidase ImmA (M78 family)